ncbi:hypothetical protein [Inquilinus sp.]|uniref:hypothetical protein n=1 Tax=Inquilinus sp. TaxID=1932117 RepID=UPI0037830F62
MARHSWDAIGTRAIGGEAGLVQSAGNDVLDIPAQHDRVGLDPMGSPPDYRAPRRQARLRSRGPG